VGNPGRSRWRPSQVGTVNLIGTFNVIRLAAHRMSELDEVDGERGVM